MTLIWDRDLQHCIEIKVQSKYKGPAISGYIGRSKFTDTYGAPEGSCNIVILFLSLEIGVTFPRNKPLCRYLEISISFPRKKSISFRRNTIAFSRNNISRKRNNISKERNIIA